MKVSELGVKGLVHNGQRESCHLGHGSATASALAPEKGEEGEKGCRPGLGSEGAMNCTVSSSGKQHRGRW